LGLEGSQLKKLLTVSSDHELDGAITQVADPVEKYDASHRINTGISSPAREMSSVFFIGTECQSSHLSSN
jgi:hypothetical protein